MSTVVVNWLGGGRLVGWRANLSVPLALVTGVQAGARPYSTSVSPMPSSVSESKQASN